MKKNKISPILIIGYNRPNKIGKLLNILKKEKNLSKIYFKIDGPKNAKDKKKSEKIFILINKFKKKKK